MSPNSRVRRFFLLIIISMLILMGFTWRFFSKRSIVHFNHADRSAFFTNNHQNEIKSTINIYAETLLERKPSSNGSSHKIADVSEKQNGGITVKEIKGRMQITEKAIEENRNHKYKHIPEKAIEENRKHAYKHIPEKAADPGYQESLDVISGQVQTVNEADTVERSFRIQESWKDTGLGQEKSEAAKTVHSSIVKKVMHILKDDGNPAKLTESSALQKNTMKVKADNPQTQGSSESNPQGQIHRQAISVIFSPQLLNETFVPDDKKMNSEKRSSHIAYIQKMLSAQNASEHNEHFRQMIEDMERLGKQPKGHDLFPVAGNGTQGTSSSGGIDQDGTRLDVCAHCFHSNFPILIDPSSFCSNVSSKTIVLLLISSAPFNEDKREAIRNTWGWKCRDGDSTYRCLFVLGEDKDEQLNRNLRRENEKYHDIIQFAFKDTYHNLTYKTLTSLHWVATHCQDIPFVMKTDDDMFINTELIPIMLTAAPSSNFMGGHCWGMSSPNRNFNSKWYVPSKTFKHSKFPPMCSGTGYIMSRDVVNKVLSISQNIPFFHLEDVYVALCLQKSGILPVRILGFSNMNVDFSACRYRNNVLTSHEVPSFLLRKYWRDIQQCPSNHHSGRELFLKLPYPET